MELGFLIKQHLFQTEDMPLLFRSMAATHVFEVAQEYAHNIVSAVNMDSALVTEIQRQISPLSKRRRKARGRRSN